MNLLRRLLGLNGKPASETPEKSLPRTSGEYITQVSRGANLVNGKPTWEHAESSKDDLETMLKCCEAELKAMAAADIVAAPFYFERAAILLRKAKQFDREIDICEQYIKAVERYYSTPSGSRGADVRKGPRFKAIVARAANLTVSFN